MNNSTLFPNSAFISTELSPFLSRDPPYMDVFSWESVKLSWWRRVFGRYGTLSLLISFTYVLLCFRTKAAMSSRPPFQFKKVLTAWNSFLAVFSLMGFLRTFPELAYEMSKTDGVYTSICKWQEHSESTAFWGLLFALSKLVELGDTAFIVLKKQRLIFLHWYHHVTVLLYVWLTYFDYEPRLRHFMVMNYFVHTIMYSYYALMSMGIKIPRKYANVITILQLLQMILGVYVNLFAWWTTSHTERNCDSKLITIYAALGMYGSYFVLFANFFRNVYNKANQLKKD